MAQDEAAQHRQALKRIASLDDLDTRTWFALVEDELRMAVPGATHLLARFEEIKGQIEATGGKIYLNPEDRLRQEKQARADCKALVSAAGELVDTAPLPPEGLKDEVERIIQKGYFHSIWFRLVLGGLALVLLLVTGVEGYKLNEQVKEMQRMVDEARQQVEQGRVEVAKGTAEAKEREAQLALLILQGNEQMVTMRTNAINAMQTQEEAFRSKVAEETKRWVEEAAKAEPPAKQLIVDAGNNGAQEVRDQTNQSVKQIDDSLKQSKTQLTNKLVSTVSALDAAERPWVPLVLWSMAKSWLIVPAALIAAILAWCNALLVKRDKTVTQWLVLLNMVFMIGVLGIVIWLR